jgi:hypothetical protein
MCRYGLQYKLIHKLVLVLGAYSNATKAHVQLQQGDKSSLKFGKSKLNDVYM